MRMHWVALAGLSALAGTLTACNGGRELDAIAVASRDADTSQALLGSTRGRHIWAEICATAPDDTVLPDDPRSRILPGVNAGLAVHFNGY